MANGKRRSRSPRPRRRRSKRRWRRWLFGAAATAVAAGALWVWFLVRSVDAFLAARGPGPIRIYADATHLRAGASLEGSWLLERLHRLGYEVTSGTPVRPGQFHVGPQRLDLVIRPFADLDGDHAAAAVRLELAQGVIRRVVRSSDGRELDEASLEPELLGTYSGGVLGERKALTLADFPRHVVAAVLAAEDARFATHPGVDPLGLLRAAWANLRGGGIRQGGSTITQQLAKNEFLSPRRSFVRKLNEALLALILEAHMTKEQILEAYLNTVYLGQADSIGIYGVAQGARAFFGKEPRDLTVAEAATIAGLIHAPNLDSPLRHPERARKRRDRVLGLMADNSWIGPAELEAARREALRLNERSNLPLEAPYFVDEVLRRVGRIGYDTGVVRGLSVYTTLDLQVQHAAERALSGGLEALEHRYRRLKKATDPLEGAIVAMESGTGYVRGLAGGRDFGRSQFNRATRSSRQPGSAFKPFVYLAAIDDVDDTITPATVLRDEPIHIRAGGGDWSPENYDGRYLGEVTVREAIEDSRNVPTVALAQHVGLARITDLAGSVGLGDIPPLPAVALGSAEVSLIDLVAAYSVFPNLGLVVRPALIRGVTASDGTLLYRDRIHAKRVATAAASYVTSHLLEGVVEEGTGEAVRRLGIARAVAGKTGTTNEAKDAWFVGYSPDLVAGVWVGFDDGSPVGLTGARAALPIWVAFMHAALPAYPDQPFEVPGGVVFREVDRHTGLLASWACPDSVREAFLAGTEPRVACDGSRVEEVEPRRKNPVFNWFERLFRVQ